MALLKITAKPKFLVVWKRLNFTKYFCILTRKFHMFLTKINLKLQFLTIQWKRGWKNKLDGWSLSWFQNSLAVTYISMRFFREFWINLWWNIIWIRSEFFFNKTPNRTNILNFITKALSVLWIIWIYIQPLFKMGHNRCSININWPPYFFWS
jgi:hypothetical protein